MHAHKSMTRDARMHGRGLKPAGAAHAPLSRPARRTASNRSEPSPVKPLPAALTVRLDRYAKRRTAQEYSNAMDRERRGETSTDR